MCMITLVQHESCQVTNFSPFAKELSTTVLPKEGKMVGFSAFSMFLLYPDIFCQNSDRTILCPADSPMRFMHLAGWYNTKMPLVPIPVPSRQLSIRTNPQVR